MDFSTSITSYSPFSVQVLAPFSKPYLAHRTLLNGGTQWLESCHHQGVDQKSKFNGVGRESPLIQGIIAGYQRSIAPTVDLTATQSSSQVEVQIQLDQQVEQPLLPQVERKTLPPAARQGKSNVVKKKSEFSR